MSQAKEEAIVNLLIPIICIRLNRDSLSKDWQNLRYITQYKQVQTPRLKVDNLKVHDQTHLVELYLSFEGNLGWIHQVAGLVSDIGGSVLNRSVLGIPHQPAHLKCVIKLGWLGNVILMATSDKIEA